MKEIMRAPGQGLLTVSTKPRSLADLEIFFSKKKQKFWAEEFEKRLAQKAPFYLLGFPSDSGGGICRGAAHGPLGLRLQLYKKNPLWASCDLGDIPCIPQLVHDSMLNEAQLHACALSLWKAPYQGSTKTPVSPLNILEEVLVYGFQRNARFRPLILGGDHSLSGAVFSALTRARKTQDLAVLHFDAHTDLLESRFGIDHCFGTWTSHALKNFAKPDNWIQVGVRASGFNKKHWEEKFGLRQFWASELKKISPQKFAANLLEHWKARACTRLYITNDIDATDKSLAPSTGTPESGGLSKAWIKAVIEHCTQSLPLIGADLVEVAPVLGSPTEARRTVTSACAYLEALRW